MKYLNLFLMTAVISICAFAQNSQDKSNFQKQSLAVVKIMSGSFDADQNLQRSLTGSGVIVDSRGIVVTSRSVVFPKNSNKEFPEIWAGVLDSNRDSLRPNQAYRLRLIAQDEKRDIALLKIETENSAQIFPTISFGETGNLRYGQELKVIGFMQANGTKLSTTDAGFLDYDDAEDLLKVEGQFLKGIAGGAIVDLQGKLIGIPVKSTISESVPFFNQSGEQVGQIAVEEVGLVVPVEAIQEFMRKVPNLVGFTIPGDLRKNVSIEGAVTDRQTNQPIRRATIGILIPNNNSRQYIEADELIAYARTDRDGGFELSRRIKPGVYSVKIVHPDYKTEYRTIRIPTDSGRLIIEMTKEAGFGVK